MGESTAIAWTDATFNPWWGCTRVSPGCEHCYAEAFAKRTGKAEWGKNAERRFFGDKHWEEPLRWNRRAEADGTRRRVFCASMADVFEDRRDLDEQRARLFDLIESTPWLDWQLLTKRPENIALLAPSEWLDVDELCSAASPDPVRLITHWPANCWVGTTVEDQKRADERIPHLLAIPAPIRFLSCEPLLEKVDLSRWLHLEWFDSFGWGLEMFGALAGDRPGIGWVIVGGESGPKHRALDLDGARDLRDQCAAARVPFFFKQVGGRTPTAGGDLLDGQAFKQFPTP